MSRIVIAGWPRCGKTTLAQKIYDGSVAVPGARGAPVRHLDSLAHLGWSEASEAAVAWLDAPGPWIVEGVAAGRALRKWHALRVGQGAPVDLVCYLRLPRVALSEGQRRMGVGCDTVWEEVRDWLLATARVLDFPT